MKKVKSIGLIETLGMVGAVEAADAATKAANVSLLGYELNRAGFVTIKLTGDVAAVKAAVSSGGATAARLGNLIATHVIARPDEQLVDVFINSPDNIPQVQDEDEKEVAEHKPPASRDASESGTEGPMSAGAKPPSQKQAPKKSTKPTPKSSELTQQAKPGGQNTPPVKPGDSEKK
jgi:microcompartment protein CcmL/EutN